jgi:hypothetical protein
MCQALYANKRDASQIKSITLNISSKLWNEPDHRGRRAGSRVG